MRYFLAVTFIFILNFSFSQESIETDRPDQTECSSVVPVKTIQVETGAIFTSNSRIGSVRYNYPTTLFRFGLLQAAELRLIAGEHQRELINFHDSSIVQSAFQPIEVGTKIYLCDEKGIRPQTSFLGHLAIPLQKGEIANAVSPDFRFSMSHTLTDIFNFGYNLGMAWECGEPYPEYIYTVTIGAGITEKFSAFIEVFGTSGYKVYPGCYADGGLSYKLKKNVQLDMSAGFGLNNYSDEFFLSVGFSFRLPH